MTMEIKCLPLRRHGSPTLSGFQWTVQGTYLGLIFAVADGVWGEETEDTWKLGGSDNSEKDRRDSYG